MLTAEDMIRARDLAYCIADGNIDLGILLQQMREGSEGAVRDVLNYWAENRYKDTSYSVAIDKLVLEVAYKKS